jgi:hypothetical protein
MGLVEGVQSEAVPADVVVFALVRVLDGEMQDEKLQVGRGRDEASPVTTWATVYSALKPGSRRFLITFDGGRGGAKGEPMR